MAPTDVHVLIPEIREMSPSTVKGTLQRRLRILRQEDYPGLYRSAQCNYKALIKGRIRRLGISRRKHDNR